MYASQNLVCSNPRIWVFDDLLSEGLLDYVDASFDDQPWTLFNGRQLRSVKLNVHDHLGELTKVLCDLCHIEAYVPCDQAKVIEVLGKDRAQTPHVDGWDITRFPEFLDLSKFSLQHREDVREFVVPTLSLVVYFNEVGGVNFPDADMSNPIIEAKRGRILMLQNYIDSQRPAHNPAAVHFGFYGNSPKRRMSAGMLSNETPAELLGSQVHQGRKTRGMLYAPAYHTPKASCPSTPESSPRSPRRAPSPPPPPVVLNLTVVVRACGNAFVEIRNLAGDVVGDFQLDNKATLGELRNSLKTASADRSRSTLVVEEQILNDSNGTLLVNTLLATETAWKVLLDADQKRTSVLENLEGTWRVGDLGKLETKIATIRHNKRADTV